MKRANILNQKIEKIFEKKQNHDLSIRLKTIKPQINIQCPKSFLLHKTLFHNCKTEHNTIYNTMKKRSKEKNQSSPHNKLLKTSKSPFKFHFHLNKSDLSSSKNNTLFKGKSFTENTTFDKTFNLNKRINQKSSVYSLSQWKKDFKQSRVYKKISCEYPSINFIGKAKRNMKHNYGFSPNVDYNIFSATKFKPFTPFEEENSKGSNSLNKKKKKRRFNFSHRKNVNDEKEEQNKNKEKKNNITEQK